MDDRVLCLLLPVATHGTVATGIGKNFILREVDIKGDSVKFASFGEIYFVSVRLGLLFCSAF